MALFHRDGSQRRGASTLKQALKSKTILFMVFMAGLEAIGAGMHYLDPVISMEQLNVWSFVVGMLTSMGGVYLRVITNFALSDK